MLIPIKKIVILDAGGVLHPDAEFGASNQPELAALTQLSESELNKHQNRDLFLGNRSLRDVLAEVTEDSHVEQKPSVDTLLNAYKKGINLYPGVPEMIRELYKAGYQVVLCTNNTDWGLNHVKELLTAEGLSCVKVYGSAEMHLAKPDENMFQEVCKAESVSPDECWFIDDRESNRKVAQSLGMSVIAFDRPEKLEDAAKSVNACREVLSALGIVKKDNFVFPPKLDRGKYPSLFGIMNDKVIRYQPTQKSYIEVDELNEDGNQRKRCLYESRLAKLIVEQGRSYWGSAYHAINQLFLADFDLKSDAKRIDEYKPYFEKIKSVLKKEGLIGDNENDTIQDLRAALVKLFAEPFDLTNVSQFYYNVWLFKYGPEPLEPFVFLTDLLKESTNIANNTSWTDEPMRLLKLFPDMAHNIDDRRQAYYVAQPWLTCGPPQLRGREARKSGAKQAETFGILRDDDPWAVAELASSSHFAAKTFFAPSKDHPISKAFRANASPIVGGSSGTLGRNLLMLAPLVQTGLLSQVQLTNYVMGFFADLVHRGHHAYEEVVEVSDQVLFPLKPWFDSLRDPKGFYEQLLTNEFIDSRLYRDFLAQHETFFETPIMQMKIN